MAIEQYLVAYIDTEVTPCANPSGKLSANNIGTFINYKITQIIGILQSCPDNYIKAFNQTGDCVHWHLNTNTEFIYPNMDKKS